MGHKPERLSSIGLRCRATSAAHSGCRFVPSTLLAAIALFAASTVSAHAQDATWSSIPGQLASGVYNINTNWTPATVPTGTAFFGASNSTTLKFLPPGATVGGWTFDTGASAYTFIANVPLLFNGAGIIINGGSATINNSSTLNFNNTSMAGSATINNSSIPELQQHQHGRQRYYSPVTAF